MKTNSETDIVLIERILRKDPLAYRALVERHKDYAFTIAYRILAIREDAEEAAQDAFLRAFNGLSAFNRDAKFTTWFYRIVVNAALTIQQKKKIITEDIDNARQLRGGMESSDNYKKQEQRHYIELALKQLPPDDVTMITLFYLKELSLEEIAETVGIETNTIKVKLHRARKRLSDVMQVLLKGEVQSLL